MSVWDTLCSLQQQGFCFHGSGRDIKGKLRPNKAFGRELHECHDAVYASSDPRPAIIKAIIRPSHVCGELFWGYEGNDFVVHGKGLSLGQKGWVYILDKREFTLSGSPCGTEFISRTSVHIVQRQVITASMIHDIPNIKLPS